jgi:hypothetical protein
LCERTACQEVLFVGFEPKQAFQKDPVEMNAGVPSIISPMANLDAAIGRWRQCVHVVRDSDAGQPPTIGHQ